MKKNDFTQAEMTGMVYPKTGVGVCEGGRIRVKGALPGQTVEARVVKTRGRLEGELTRVIRPAPNEIPPDCPAFGTCGGCAFRALPYANEARLKERMALDLFDRAGISGFAYDGFVPARNPTAYRNKMEYAFGDDGLGGNLTLGLRRRGSYYEAVNAEGCLLCHPDFGVVVRYTREHFAARGVAFYHRAKQTGALRHLVVRRGQNTGEMLVNLVTAPNAGLDIAAWADMLMTLPLAGRIVSVWHTESGAAADIVKPEAARLVGGQPYFEERLLGLRFRVTPFSFFQTNSAEAARLYETALGYAGRGGTLFDLYCGTGTIAQLCASRGVAERVTGVEIVPEAAEAARENAALNNVAGCDFITGDVLKTLAQLPARPDILVVDPPREGIHPKALRGLAALGAGRVAYVSCNPATLAGDLAAFAEGGYVCKRLRFHDLFPRAAHVESVALLER